MKKSNEGGTSEQKELSKIYEVRTRGGKKLEENERKKEQRREGFKSKKG